MDFKWENSQGPVEKDSPFFNGITKGVKFHTFAGHKRQYTATTCDYHE